MGKTRKAAGGKKEVSQGSIVYNIAFWGFTLIIILSPLLRGLFFTFEQRVAVIFAIIFFWFIYYYYWNNRKLFFNYSILDWAVLSLLIIYIMATFNAANYGLAIDEVVKNTILVLTYFTASRLVRNMNDIVKILHILLISGLLVALSGIISATEIISLKEGYVSGRIYTAMQYPNAAVSFLSVAFIIGVTLWFRQVSGDTGEKVIGIPGYSGITSGNLSVLYGVSNFIILTVLMGTQSRGGILVFAFALFLYILLRRGFSRLAILIQLAILIPTSYIAMKTFISLVEKQKLGLAILSIFIGMLVVVLLNKAYLLMVHKRLANYMEEPKGRRTVGYVGIAVVLATCAALIMAVDIMGKITNFQYMFNAYSRLYFMKDALEMIAARPVLGWGGGGWQEAYRYFQDYYYISAYVHSHILQVGVETGILGMLAMLSTWLIFGVILIKLYIKFSDKGEVSALITCIAVSGLVIQLHSIIDFDLTLLALAMMLWILLGLCTGVYNVLGVNTVEKIKQAREGPKGYQLALVSLLTAFIIMSGISMAESYKDTEAGERYARQNDGANTLMSLKNAVRTNPFDPRPKVGLAQVYTSTGKHAEAFELASEAARYSKFSSFIQMELARIAAALEREDVTVYVERAVELEPYNRDLYLFKAKFYLNLATRELLKGDKQKAKGYLESAAGVSETVKKKYDSVPDNFKQMWLPGRVLEVTPAINLVTGASNYLLGIYDVAEKQLLSIGDNDKEIGDAYAWLSMIELNRGNKQKADEYLAKAKGKGSQLINDYELLSGMSVKEK